MAFSPLSFIEKGGVWNFGEAFRPLEGRLLRFARWIVCVEHFLCNLSLAGVLVRPHLAQSRKILQLSTTDSYLFVV